MQDADGLPLREPHTPQMVFRMQLPRPVPAMSIVRPRRRPFGKVKNSGPLHRSGPLI